MQPFYIEYKVIIIEFNLFSEPRSIMHSDFPKVADIGQVWGWGYGGEGQLGLGSRIRMVSSPHPIPCIDSSSYGRDRSSAISRGSMSEGQSCRVPGTYVKAIACGGRHSAVITGSATAVFLFKLKNFPAGYTVFL